MRKLKDEQKGPSKLCYLCGRPGADSKEHVLSRCLFPSIPPNNLITLPAHKACHEPLAKAEEYFRNMLVGLSHQKPAAKKLWETKVKRSIERSNGLRMKMAQSLVPRIDVYSKGGVYLKTASGVRFDMATTERVISKIVRGLYYYHYRPDILPLDLDIRWCIDPPHKQSLKDFFFTRKPHDIGKGIFSYRYDRSGEDYRLSVWFLWFYDTVLFSVTTQPAQRD